MLTIVKERCMIAERVSKSAGAKKMRESVELITSSKYSARGVGEHPC